MSIDFSGKHMGKLCAKHDARVPMLLSLVSGELPDPPDEQNWYSSIAAWPMDDNDTESDCTSAAAAHAIQQWTLYGQGMSVIMQASLVMGLYQKTKAPDQEGAFLLDVLKFWMNTGIETGYGNHKITAFIGVDVSNLAHTKCAIAWFGNLIVGLSLPLSAKTQDEVWDTVPGPASGVGTWGGHCVLLVGYDATYLWFVSWGRLMKMTHLFYQTYCDEAYAILTRDFVKPPGNAPSGLPLPALIQRMKALKTNVSEGL